MAIYKRGKTYHTDVTVNGIRYRESLETTNWQEAQRLQKELIVRVSEGKAGAPIRQGQLRQFAARTSTYGVRERPCGPGSGANKPD